MTTLSAVVPNTAREAVDQFLKEFEMLKAEKSPDGVGVALQVNPDKMLELRKETFTA